jgi:hypothetical protein
VLAGGLGVGMTHLLYHDRQVHDYFLHFAVQAQLPLSKVGVESPTVILDSSNSIRVDRITDYSFDPTLEPKTVTDRIFVNRTFDSSPVQFLTSTFDARLSNRVVIQLPLTE